IAGREGSDWVISGRKCFISGVDEAPLLLVVARFADSSGRLAPALFLVPTDAPGLERSKLEMEIVSPESQFLLFFDDVRVPADALIGGDIAAGRPPGFSRGKPERVTAARARP